MANQENKVRLGRVALEGVPVGMGGARAECDGVDHWWIMSPEMAKKFDRPAESHIGPCRCSGRQATQSQSPPAVGKF